MPMAAPSKAQFLNNVLTLLKKRYKLEPSAGRMSVLEATVYGICHEDTTREQANQALSRFNDDFFDWNEVRVSSVEEIQAVLAGVPNPEDRAARIRRFLRQLFSKTYSFTALEALVKKSQKEAVKALQQYEAFSSDYVLATVLQQALGGHAIPLDQATRRCLERLGVADPKTDTASLRAALERAVPKPKSIEFTDLMAELAHSVCTEGVPDCPHCELRKICPTGLERKAEWSGAKATAKDGLSEPKAAKRKAPRAK
jgi:endonuclease III